MMCSWAIVCGTCHTNSEINGGGREERAQLLRRAADTQGEVGPGSTSESIAHLRLWVRKRPQREAVQVCRSRRTWVRNYPPRPNLHARHHCSDAGCAGAERGGVGSARAPFAALPCCFCTASWTASPGASV